MSQYQSYLIVDSSISFCFVLMFRVIFCYYKMNFVFVVSGTSTSVCLMKKTNYIFPRLHYPVFFNLSEIFPFLFSMSFFLLYCMGSGCSGGEFLLYETVERVLLSCMEGSMLLYLLFMMIWQGGFRRYLCYVVSFYFVFYL
jgi:hypothetical protein